MDTVDNVTKECLSNCEDQVNDLFVTTSSYPNKKTFKDREIGLSELTLVKT